MSDFDRDCGRCSLIRISEPEVGAYYLVVIAPNRAFVHLSTFSKGQIISKGHFGVFNSSKKQTKNFCHSRLGKNLNFQVRFLGELKAPKVPFEIN